MSYETFIKSQLYKRRSINLTRLGFDFSSDAKSEFLKIQSMLYSAYHIRCGSMITIMKDFDIPSSRTLDILFREFEIEARSLSAATSNANEQERGHFLGTPFQHIYHTTWDGQRVMLRSSHELEYAKLLDEAKVVYFVEHQRIKYLDRRVQSYKIAVPDFYLPATNTITEVKATYWFDPDGMEARRIAYADLGYRFNLYLDGKLHEDWKLVV